MRRSRRRMLGLVTTAAVHGLAAYVLLPVAKPDVPPEAAHPPAPPAPLVIVQLVHWRPAAAPQIASAAMPASAPKPKSVSQPEQPAPFDVALSEPEDPVVLPPPTPPEDDDPLYRVPFRDAVAQADARLRAGLDCDHVDLQQLPKTTFDLCAAAARVKDPIPPRPLG